MGEYILSTILPWIITVLLSVTIAIMLSYVPRMIKSLFKMPKAAVTALFAIVIAGALLRFVAVPNEQRVLFDEDRYLSYAVTFAKFGRAVEVNLATPDKHILGHPDQAVRSTVPVINAWILKFTNFHEMPLHYAAKTINTLQILLFFVFVYIVFNNYRLALIAAFGMAFFPVIVYWSTSTGLDSYFIFFALLAMTAATHYAREPTLRSTIFLSVTSFLLFCVRVESLVFLPLILFQIGTIRKDSNKKLVDSRDFRLLAVSAPFLVTRIAISVAVIGQKWCCAEGLPLEAFAPTYTVRNLLLNIMSLFTQPEIPFILTIFAFVAAVNAFTNKIWRTHVFTIWFVAYFILYSSYYAGRFFSYEYSGSYGRFFLMLIPPFIILASLSLETLINRMQFSKSKGRTWIIAVFIVSILSLYPTVSQYRMTITRSPYFDIVEKMPHITRTFFTKNMLPRIPKNAIVIHNLTAISLMSGRPTVYLGLFTDNDAAIDYVRKSLKRNIPVYSLEMPQCLFFPKRCTKIARHFKFVPIVRKGAKPTDINFGKIRLRKPQEPEYPIYAEN